MRDAGSVQLLGRCRIAAGTAYRRGASVLQRLDPVRWVPSGAAGGSTGLVCVYRTRNAPVVRQLLDQLPVGAAAALWCLDGDPPGDLAALTVGAGPGARPALLNRLVAGLPTDLAALVLVDDDVRMEVGDLRRLLAVGQRMHLDVYQPAHLASSHASWDFVRRRRWTYARTTDFVEQGPLLVLSPAGRAVVLPLPEDIGMAWGVEVRWWAQARRQGARLGIVDAVAVRHLVPAAGAYDRAGQEQRLQAELEREGLTSLEQLHVVRERVGLREALRSRR